MKRSLPITAIIALASSPIDPAIGWGSDGHKIVCAIAWDHMRAPARRLAREILSIESKAEFADLCNWADDYRSSHPETSGWHFLNVAPDSSSIDRQRDCKEANCVIDQIYADLDVLRGGSGDKAMAIKFLMHFVGDVHQPLHVSFADDRGGNAIEGSFLGRKTNMHSLWDSGMIQAKVDAEKQLRPAYDWQNLASTLSRSVTSAERSRWSQTNPVQWATESLNITLDVAAGYRPRPATFAFDSSYQAQNFPTVTLKLRQAGYRLAYLLNDVAEP